MRRSSLVSPNHLKGHFRLEHSNKLIHNTAENSCCIQANTHLIDNRCLPHIRHRHSHRGEICFLEAVGVTLASPHGTPYPRHRAEVWQRGRGEKGERTMQVFPFFLPKSKSLSLRIFPPSSKSVFLSVPKRIIVFLLSFLSKCKFLSLCNQRTSFPIKTQIP